MRTCPSYFVPAHLATRFFCAGSHEPLLPHCLPQHGAITDGRRGQRAPGGCAQVSGRKCRPAVAFSRACCMAASSAVKHSCAHVNCSCPSACPAAPLPTSSRWSCGEGGSSTGSTGSAARHVLARANTISPCNVHCVCVHVTTCQPCGTQWQPRLSHAHSSYNARLGWALVTAHGKEGVGAK